MVDKIRNWLTKNKIFFETIAAALLSLMAIIISIVQITIAYKQTELTEEQAQMTKHKFDHEERLADMQIRIANKQTQLAEIQTQIARKQLRSEEKHADIEKSANWGELRNAIWKFFEQFPPSGIETLKSFPQENQLLFFKNIRTILDSQIKNPVLIENRNCLGYWRNAISGAKSMVEMLSKTDMSNHQDSVVAVATGIFKDMSYVWNKLIMDSKEVSPAGGRPNKTN